MLLADARLAASIMMSCSITASFTGDAWVWTMKTCAPRIDSSNATVDLAVGELAQVRLGELDAELVGDVLGERGMAPPRDDNEATFGECLHARQRTR